METKNAKDNRGEPFYTNTKLPQIPRLIFYNDSHHFNAKRIDPPASIYRMRRPVDELLGTGVNWLVIGLGYGDVYFHDSRVGRVIGQEKEKWESIINWRIMRMVRDARDLGTDHLKIVIQRGKETGITVFPSLKLQDGSPPGNERCGWLKWKHGKAVCIGEKDERHPGFEYSYDFANDLVRDDKKNMVREILACYEAEGLELDFAFFAHYFKKAERDKNISLMNSFVGEIRRLADDIGKTQGRNIGLSARVFHLEEDNLRAGLDVAAWLKEGYLDLVVGQVPYSLFDTNLDTRWICRTARSAGVPAYIRPPGIVDDERSTRPSIHMFRALVTNLAAQGCAGLYLGYLPWPLSLTEYQILRETAFPDTLSRKTKLYYLQPREDESLFTSAPERQLPLALKSGEKNRFIIRIEDDLESARREKQMYEPVLSILFQGLPVENSIEFTFNGKFLDVDDFEISSDKSNHWFRYFLHLLSIRQGNNTIEIEQKRGVDTAGWDVIVKRVEIRVRYKEFMRPPSLKDIPRIDIV